MWNCSKCWRWINLLDSGVILMIKKIGDTIIFKNNPTIIAGCSVVGPKEKNSLLNKYFDKIMQDDICGEKTYEKAERKFMEHAITGAIKKAGLTTNDIDFLISGDLLDQIISSNFVARILNTSFIGIFGACSNMSLSLALGACLIEAGVANYVACATSSHFSTAERQFRFPLELGCQRPPTAQWTVTASGCSILSNNQKGHKVIGATIGKVVDFGINDVNNMGAAMAPAAADTLDRLFKDTKTTPKDYDLIVTGDLGKLGSELLLDLLEQKGYSNIQNHRDCGQIIYSDTQKSYMGGSGCGCGASVFNSYFLDKLTLGEYKKIIFMATGALLSPLSSQQGESIPSIAHAIIIEKGY